MFPDTPNAYDGEDDGDTDTDETDGGDSDDDDGADGADDKYHDNDEDDDGEHADDDDGREEGNLAYSICRGTGQLSSTNWIFNDFIRQTGIFWPNTWANQLRYISLPMS